MTTQAQQQVKDRMAQAAGAKQQHNVAELRQKSKLPARQAGAGVVQQFFESNKASMAAVLPKHVSPERMTRIALGALRTTPKLMECTVESLMGAVMTCSQLGLEPNNPLGHAYLIPFDKKQKNRQTGQWEVVKTEVNLVIGYKGLIDLARRSGQIESIQAHAVFDNDEWEFEFGLEEKLRHVPARGNRGNIIAFYAVAKLKGGGHQFEWMWTEDVNKIRDESQGFQAAKRNADRYKKEINSPWVSHYEAMGRKTVARQLCKFLPMSIELAAAVTIDEGGEGHMNQNLDGALNTLDGEFTVVTPGDDAQDDHPGDDPGHYDQAQEQGQQEAPQAATDPAPHWPQKMTDPDTGETMYADKGGELFDKTKFQVDSATGEPRMTKDGFFMKKGGGK